MDNIKSLTCSISWKTMADRRVYMIGLIPGGYSLILRYTSTNEIMATGDPCFITIGLTKLCLR